MRRIILRTHRVPPTGTKGAKIHVHVEGKQVTFTFPYEENDPHLWAAKTVVEKFGLGNADRLTMDGTLANGHRFVLVVDDEPVAVQTRSNVPGSQWRRT